MYNVIETNAQQWKHVPGENSESGQDTRGGERITTLIRWERDGGEWANEQVVYATAAEEDYPGEAIRLYKNVIQKLIDGRGRENYQQAIGYMMRIRMLYQMQGQEMKWDAYITNLRNSNKSLRALKEELDKRAM